MDIKELQSVKNFVDIISKALDIVIDEEKHIEAMVEEWKERENVACH